MKKRQKSPYRITWMFGLVILAFSLVLFQNHAAKAQEDNPVFQKFERSDYPSSTNALAKEIATYANYILPIISSSENNGCLGARPFDKDTSFEDQTDQDAKKPKLHLVNRCSQIYPSDLARLNFIVALNADFNSDSDNREHCYRYVLKDDTTKNQIKSAMTDAPNPNEVLSNSVGLDPDAANQISDVENPKNVLEAAAADNDKVFLDSLSIERNPIHGKGSDIRVSDILPSASSSLISTTNNFGLIGWFMAPGVDLMNNNQNKSLFGTNNNYTNSYLSFVNKALKNCVQETSEEPDWASDRVTISRAITLNQKAAALLTSNQVNLAECKAKCVAESKQNYDDLDSKIEEVVANSMQEFLDNDDIFEQWCPDNSCSSSIKENFLDNTWYDTSHSIKSQAIKEFNKHFQCPNLKTGTNNESQRYQELDCDTALDAGNLRASIRDAIYKIARNHVNKATSAAAFSDHLYEFLYNKVKDLTTSANVNLKNCLDLCGDVKLHFGAPTCATLVNILAQIDSEKDARSALSSRISSNNTPEWLPLSPTEKQVMNYQEDYSEQDGCRKIENIEATSQKSACYFTGWSAFICTITNFISRLTDGAFNAVSAFLKFPSDLLNTKDNAQHSLFGAWQVFRDISNLVLVVLIFIAILSEISGYQTQKFGLKKNFFRLILAAVLVNVSFLICQLVVDLSHLIGGSIRGFFSNQTTNLISQAGLTETLNANNARASTGLFSTVAWTLLGLAAAGVALSVIAGGLIILFPMLVGALVSFATTVFILIFRQVVIVLLVLLAPIAFVMAANNFTENYLKKWWHMLFGVLITYPLISLAFSVGDFTFNLLNIATFDENNMILKILSLLLLILPVILVPKLIKGLISNLPIFGSALANMSQKLSGGVKSRISNSKLYQATKQQKEINRQQDRAGVSNPKSWQLLRRFRRGYNRTLHNLPGLRGIYTNTVPTSQEESELIKKAKLIRDNNNYNGARATEALRGAINNPNYRPEELLAHLFAAADDSGGSSIAAEDIIITLNQLSGQIKEQQELVDIVDTIQKAFTGDGRSDISAVIKRAGQMSNGKYNFSNSNNVDIIIQDFNNQLVTSTGAADVHTAYQSVIQPELERKLKLENNKFKGFNTNNESNRSASTHYHGAGTIASGSTGLSQRAVGGTTADPGYILSTGAARDAFYNAYNSNEAFADRFNEYVLGRDGQESGRVSSIRRWANDIGIPNNDLNRRRTV